MRRSSPALPKQLLDRVAHQFDQRCRDVEFQPEKRLLPHLSSSLPRAARDWRSPSRHGAREKIVHALLWFHARIEFIDGNFEDASKTQLLKITDMHQPAFDFGYLAAINVPTGELQPRC